MSLAVASNFFPTLISGQGFIALVVMIFGKWKPHGAMVACFVFGGAQALVICVGGTSLRVPQELLPTLPYLLTLVILMGFVGRAVSLLPTAFPISRTKAEIRLTGHFPSQEDMSGSGCRKRGGVSMRKAPSLFLTLFLMSLLFGAIACADPLPLAFVDALADTAVAERSEIVRDLVDINTNNQDLISRDIGGETFVLVASLVNGNYYDGFTEEVPYADAHPAIWVTVVPELKDFFVEETAFPDDICLRVVQLLGMRPEDVSDGNGGSRVVEFWVRPADLVRPCPDPGISDREAELDFPAIVREYSPDFYLGMDWSTSAPLAEDWMEWFNANRNYDPGSSSSYPWTRLGYTYDWGDEEDHVGLSEFIMESDAVIYVHSVQSMDRDYFTAPAGDGSSGGCSAFSPVILFLVLLPGGWCLVQALRKRREG